MNEKEKHSEAGKFRWKKWAIIFGVLIVMITGFRLFLKSDFLFERIRHIAEDQAGARINGSLRLTSISGDLLSGITVTGAELRDQNEETVLTLDTLRIEFRFWSLIRSPYTLEKAELSGLGIFLNHEAESGWNVMHLLDMADGEEGTDPLQWVLESITIRNGAVFIRSEQLLPDGYLNVTGLNVGATAGFGNTGFYGTLHQFEMNLEEARLPESINLLAEGSTEDGRITLESLVINSGRSMLQAAGSYRDEGNVNGQIGLNRISWRDLAAYMEGLPLVRDMEMNLGVSGSLDDLTLSLYAQAEGLDSFRLGLRGSVSDSVKLREADIELENLDAPVLTGDDTLPMIGRMHYQGRGEFFPEHPEQVAWAGDLSLGEITYGGYRLSRFLLVHDLDRGKLDVNGSLGLDAQLVSYSAEISGLFDDVPRWIGRISGSDLDPSLWLNNEDLEGDLRFSADFNGSGLNPEMPDLNAEIKIDGNRFGTQVFRSLTVNGSMNRDQITGAAELNLDESEITAYMEIRNWQAEPDYDFELALNSFNASEMTLTQTELIPTMLNGVLQGSGRLFDPEGMSVNAGLRFDSSFVNGEEIETLQAQFRIENTRLFVDEARLESPIADASITLNQHLFEFTNPSNTLNFNAELKNLQPLAEQFGLDKLNSGGSVQGQLSRNTVGILQFDAETALTEIEVDTLFRASELNGTVTAFLKEDPEAELQFEILRPVINEFEMQDITFSLIPVFTGDLITGRMGFEIVGDEGSSLTQQGEFRSDSSSVVIRTDLLNLTSDLRTLSLSQPFVVYLENNTIRTDTLLIESSGGTARLALWVPGVDSTRQEVGLEAENLNMGVMQSVIMENPVFQGLLSGSMYVMNSPDSLYVKADGDVTSLNFRGSEMDSIRFDVQIEDEWLNGRLGGWNQNTLLFDGDLRVPFMPGDPLTFDDRFFDREIEGRFELAETDLSYWLGFALNDEDEDAFSDTDARIRFTVNLAGEAGNPQLNGSFQLREGVLSGIAVDSMGVDLDYRHDSEKINLNGLVIAQQNPVLRFDADLPFNIDLRRAEILLPGNEDSVSVNLFTENFNLAIFNDFVDRQMIRQIAGRLNGEINVEGTLGDFKPNGRMELTNGSMRIVPAGINISQIGALINVQPDRIELQQFSMSSGPGRMRADGYVLVNNLTPGDINLNIRGNQFRAANTSEYNALVDLTASLSGTFQEPDLRGDLTFLSGFVNLQNFGDTAVEDVRLDDEEETEPVDFYESLAMEMNVRFPREFFIRNRQFLDMEIELGGDVDLVKVRNEDLQMFGNLEGVRGYARPLGKNFILDEANITFSGPIENPNLNVITRYNPPQYIDVRIFYIIEGTAQNPEFRFDSEPQLELQDIISYTLFGKPFYELESWEQVVAGTGSSPSATDLALDVLLDRVESIASQRLGIDVVQIDNSGSGSSSTTSIKTGWYLNRRTFFAILNEISGSKPKTLFMLEYMLNENLELLITQGDDSREGIDLRWNYDY
jgi:autotransporter translocation and assembly factor TamB